MTSETEQIDAELAALVEPVRAHVRLLDEEIERREAELAELRVVRTKAKKMLAFIDPSSVPPKKQRNTDGVVTSTPQVAAETLDRVEGWLRAHKAELNGNGGFSAPTLLREHGFDLVSRATLTNALNQLHAAGTIRLDHRGQGGTKFFRVVG